MTVEVAQGIVDAVGLYLALGVIFAIAFVSVGVARVDANARGMPIAARLLILPGTAGLWPLLLVKWLRRSAPPLT